MSARRTVAVGLAAWLAVVAAGSTFVWVVISQAGDVVPAAGPVDGASATSQPEIVPDPGPVRRSRRPAPSPAPSPAPGTASASPGGPSPSAAASSPAPPPATSSTSEAAVAQRRTWQGSGGYVSVQCRGARISLVAAQADPGFRVEVDERGPVEVRVELEGQGEEERRTEVRAQCSGGTPVLDVRTDHD